MPSSHRTIFSLSTQVAWNVLDGLNVGYYRKKINDRKHLELLYDKMKAWGLISG